MRYVVGVVASFAVWLDQVDGGHGWGRFLIGAVVSVVVGSWLRRELQRERSLTRAPRRDIRSTPCRNETVMSRRAPSRPSSWS